MFDHPIRAKLDYAAAAVTATIAAERYGVSGAGIGVAVIDSGITPGAEFAGRIVYNEDFTGGNADDPYGHGGHVAGIIAGDGGNSHCATCNRNLQGFAPAASIVNLRVLDRNGDSSDSIVIAAIERAIELRSKYNIRVMNLSLGRPVFESYTRDPLCRAVEAAWKAGIVVVVAAGNDGRCDVFNNDGYGTINAPANDPYVITVGAMKTLETYNRADDLIASYSSKGPPLIDNIAKPDLVAPGNLVVSVLSSRSATLPKLYPETLIPTRYYDSSGSSIKSSAYYQLSGTSMAAAVVSGAVADRYRRSPTLRPTRPRPGSCKRPLNLFRIRA